jgi:ribosomal protein L11 methyltransferase
MSVDNMTPIVIRAMGDADYRETLFADFDQAVEGCDLTEPEREFLQGFSRERLESLVGTLVMHDVAPMRAGKRVWIVPNWWTEPLDAGAIAIRLQTGVVFGNGSHATTRLCVTALEKYLRPGNRVFDLGTGSGILAIAAARLGARSVLAVDLSPIAAETAQHNVKANQVERCVRVECGSLDVVQTPEHHQPPFDLVTANLLTPILLDVLASGVSDVLRPGGLMIASGFPQHHLPAIKKSALAVGLRTIEHRQLEGWSGIVLRKQTKFFISNLIRRK